MLLHCFSIMLLFIPPAVTDGVAIAIERSNEQLRRRCNNRCYTGFNDTDVDGTKSSICAVSIFCQFLPWLWARDYLRLFGLSEIFIYILWLCEIESCDDEASGIFVHIQRYSAFKRCIHACLDGKKTWNRLKRSDTVGDLIRKCDGA